MITSVLYIIITIVLIIVLIYFMSKPKTTPTTTPETTPTTPLDTFLFDNINGHPNVFKNLRIQTGLGEIPNNSMIHDNSEINGTVTVGGTNATISTSTDTILSNVVNVINMSEFSVSLGASIAYYRASDTDMSIFDNTKDYVVTCYVKRLSINENDKGVIKYTLGLKGKGFDPIIGENESSMIHFSAIPSDFLVSNEWYLMVGVVRQVGSKINKVSSGTGIHRLSTRKNITQTFTQDYIMKDDNMANMGLTAMLSNIREYGISTNTAGITNTKVSFTKPFIFEVDNATDSIVNGIVETMLGGKK
jgi:hypothetical protein